MVKAKLMVKAKIAVKAKLIVKAKTDRYNQAHVHLLSGRLSLPHKQQACCKNI